MTKLKVFLSILLLSLSLTACGASTKTHFQRRGFDVDRNHKLLNVKAYSERYSKSSWSAGFLFVVGVGGGSSHSGVKYKVGFVMSTSNGGAVVMRVNAEDVDYRLDRRASVPYVRLYEGGYQCFEGSYSLTKNLNNCLDRVMINLTPKDFSQDIAVIKYVGAA